jgi:hypothetical protein
MGFCFPIFVLILESTWTRKDQSSCTHTNKGLNILWHTDRPFARRSRNKQRDNGHFLGNMFLKTHHYLKRC